MKKILVIALIIILIVTVIYYRDNLIDLTKIRMNIKYYDISNDNRNYDLISGIEDGFIEVASIDTHARGYHNLIFLKGWKPYEKLEIFKKQGKLYIYYEEENTTKQENVLLSFPLNFKTDKNNTIIYVNGAFL